MPAAQAGLDDRRVHAGPRELGERGRRQRLELRCAHRFRLVADPAERRVEIGLLPAYPDPLDQETDMGRRVAPALWPSASRSASADRVVVVLPFVPTT